MGPSTGQPCGAFVLMSATLLDAFAIAFQGASCNFEGQRGSGVCWRESHDIPSIYGIVFYQAGWYLWWKEEPRRDCAGCFWGICDKLSHDDWKPFGLKVKQLPLAQVRDFDGVPLTLGFSWMSFEINAPVLWWLQLAAACRSCVSERLWLGKEFYYSTALPVAIVNCQPYWKLIWCWLGFVMITIQSRTLISVMAPCGLQENAQSPMHCRILWACFHVMRPEQMEFIVSAAGPKCLCQWCLLFLPQDSGGNRGST